MQFDRLQCCDFITLLGNAAARPLATRAQAPKMPLTRFFNGQRIAALVVLVGLIFPTCTVGQTSQEYAAMGRKLWAAFECAALADVLDDAKQKQRLFNLGYEEGKTFLNALQAGKVTKEHINSEVPITVLFLLGGPSIDFILGRIWEAAIEDATKEALKAGDEKLKIIVAKGDYSRKNCSLIQ